MSRWLKITFGVIGGLIVLLLLNALVVSNETKSAYVRDDGARLIETSGGTLQVLDQGNPQGPPIVLLHCATCSMDWWDNLAPLLEDDHRVIRIDLLGMGGSDKPGSGYSIDDQAGAVAEALAICTSSAQPWSAIRSAAASRSTLPSRAPRSPRGS